MMGKQKQLMAVCSRDLMEEHRVKGTYKVTSEEAENHRMT